MKLYKYISFSNNYWFDPIIDKSLFFSTPTQLKSVNDQEEFSPNWSCKNLLMNDLKNHLSTSYNSLFSNTRVLCLAQRLCQNIWNTFINNGGVCYEFFFTESDKNNDINSSSITYSPNRNLNVPSYILSQISNQGIRGILGEKHSVTRPDRELFLNWMCSHNKLLRNIIVQHIEKEITFKKSNTFVNENEYRYVHIEHAIDNVHLTTKMKNSKITFQELGLTLNKIYSTDIEKVKKVSSEYLIEKFIP